MNHTGLMWESAEEFGALLVFAEHRYYGQSMPFPPKTAGCMNFLTTEQAMADFAYLIDYLRTNGGAQKSAVSERRKLKGSSCLGKPRVHGLCTSYVKVAEFEPFF